MKKKEPDIKTAEHFMIPKGQTIILNGKRRVLAKDISVFPSSSSEMVQCLNDSDIDTVLVHADQFMTMIGFLQPLMDALVGDRWCHETYSRKEIFDLYLKVSIAILPPGTLKDAFPPLD